MGALGRNLVINVGGRAWTALVQIAFIPVLLRLLGADGFGLVGVFLTLQAAAQVLENSYALTVNREIARRRGRGQGGVPAVLRTAEAMTWLTALAFAGALALLAPWLVDIWVKSEALPDTILTNVLWLMAPTLGLQLSAGLYVGALLATDRHGRANMLLAITATLRSGGAAGVLYSTDGGILTYFLWQIAVALFHVGAGAFLAWRSVRHNSSEPARFERGHFRLFAFSGGGMLGIGLLGAVLAQMDRIVLTRFGGLADLGYYMIASGLAGVLLYLAGPISQSMFPALSAALGRGDHHEAERVFGLGSQVLGVLAVPAGLILAVFGREIVTAWTGDAALAAHLAPIVALLAIGSTLNALVYLTSHLYLASGRTALISAFSGGAAIVLAAVLVPLVERFGALGAAAGWLGLNLAYVIILTPLILRRMLPGYTRTWAFRAVLVPLAAASVPVFMARLAMPADGAIGIALGLAVAAGMAAVGLGGLAAPDLRAALLARRRKTN